MFYRRKFYVVRNDFVDIFNEHFNKTNLPNQIKHGARLIGRWMCPIDNEKTEIFAIWEYDSYDSYKQIEINVRSDQQHVDRIEKWFEEHGGRQYVMSNYIIELRNEQLYSTLNSAEQSQHEVQFWQIKTDS